jgi:hypothetical protein
MQGFRLSRQAALGLLLAAATIPYFLNLGASAYASSGRTWRDTRRRWEIADEVGAPDLLISCLFDAAGGHVFGDGRAKRFRGGDVVVGGAGGIESIHAQRDAAAVESRRVLRIEKHGRRIV